MAASPRRLAPTGMLIVFGALVLVVTLVEVQVAAVAFTLAGLDPIAVAAVLLGCLLGSAVNIPVARLATGHAAVRLQLVRAYGFRYLSPVAVPVRTVIAVNLGGAVIPTAASVYLTAHTGLWLEAAVAVVAVSLVVHPVARPVPEVGITLPPLVPAVAAAVVAIVLNPGAGAAALAYVGGTLGTLVGADLTHLGAIRRLRVPRASIGGAGTFDGVFIAGIIAVLLSALL